MDIRGRTLPQHVAHAVSASLMYLSLVDLPSVAGGTTPLMAAGQAALASSASANMLIYLNSAAYQAGVQGDGNLDRQLYDWVRNRIGQFVDWSTRNLANLSPEDRTAETEQLQQTVQNVRNSIARGDPWTQHARVMDSMSLLLGTVETPSIQNQPVPALAFETTMQGISESEGDEPISGSLELFLSFFPNRGNARGF